MTEQEHIYLCAVRYALGRRTYITDIVSDFMRKQKLSDKCKRLMIRDIEECDDLGNECDKASWQKLLYFLNPPSSDE